MRHIAIARPGAAGRHAHVARAGPAPGTDDVLIEVAFAGVNRPDCAQRAGTYPPPPDASPILGLEVAGRVVARGANVDAWSVGDEVCALTPGGGYAEYCVTPASVVPADSRRAGPSSRRRACRKTIYTVWNNVFDRGGCSAARWFLVHGGTSGIGTDRDPAREGIRGDGDHHGRQRGKSARSA